MLGSDPVSIQKVISAFEAEICSKSNQIIFIGQRSSKDDQVGGGSIWEGSFGCEFFYVDRCVLREWVVKGGGLDGYFGDLT